jgi:integrating conjugative element protein (TIGR03765 family)
MLQSRQAFNRLLGLIPGLLVTSLIIATDGSRAAEPHGLIVIEDHGGAPALPYYRALNLLPDASTSPPPDPASVPPLTRPATDGDMLPVHSTRLTPGDVVARTIRAPGLMPTFVIGDDPRSRAWLQRRSSTLRAMGAMGLVVQVDSAASLEALRQLAHGVTLVPASGDDLAQRLDLRHYPALITATGIEP